MHGAFPPAVARGMDTLRVIQVYAWLGVEPPRGVLLHGPPGCGKTALANAIANQCGVPFLRVSAPEIVSGMSGMLHG
jgi:ribosome biogenesis ATPase